MATNKPGFVPYRGVARTGVCFAMELTMDAIAREVGREPWEIRQENLVQGEQMPYVNVTGKHLDSGDYPASLRQAMDMIGVDAIRERQRRGEADGRLIGVGLATYTEQAAHGTSVFAAWGTPVIPGFDQATAGHARWRAGAAGRRAFARAGMETTFAQIANEILGVDVASIKLLHGDTGQTPFSTGTYASRSLVMSGGAVSQACKRLLPRLTHIGAHLLQADAASVAWNGDRLEAGGKSVSVRTWPTPGTCGRSCCRPTWIPPDWKSPSATSRRSTPAVSPTPPTRRWWRWTRTGGVEILDYVVVEDCGTMINPMVVEGQTIGGVAQGIGTAFYEETPYDDNGQPLASTLADYMLPGATEVPNMRLHHFETPSPHTEFGAKGMGEGGAIAPPAVLFNAVNDALRPLGAPSCAHAAVADAGARRHRAGQPPARARQRGGDGMKAAAFEYTRPGSLQEALRALRAHEGRAKLMAGGQSLGPMLNLRLARPPVVIDISGLAELRTVTRQDGGLRVGAAVTHAEIEDGVHELLRGTPLQQVAPGIAYRAIRNRGTLGGSLAHADPAADWVLTMVGLGATLEIAGGRGPHAAGAGLHAGRLHHRAARGRADRRRACARGGPAARWGYKFCRKTGEFAEASCAAWFDAASKTARIAVGALDGAPGLLPGWPRASRGKDWRAWTRPARRRAGRRHAGQDEHHRKLHGTAVTRCLAQALG